MASQKAVSKDDKIIADLEKLYTKYMNHGDSLKWFRSRKIALLESHGLKTKEQRDLYLEKLKKGHFKDHKIKPYL